MNVRYILTLVRQLAPQLTDCRADEVGKGLYALHCKRDGMARCVQFDGKGIYGAGYGFNLPKSDDVIAVELAQELSR